jgi:hypothetical protein
MSKIPVSELIATLPEEARASFRAVCSVVDSLYRDYHDTKGHPEMTLDEHIGSCGLTAEGAAFVRAQVSVRGSFVVEVAGHRIECNPPALQYTDLDAGRRVYEG